MNTLNSSEVRIMEKMYFKAMLELRIKCDSIESAQKYMEEITNGAMNGVRVNCEAACCDEVEFYNQFLIIDDENCPFADQIRRMKK